MIEHRIAGLERKRIAILAKLARLPLSKALAEKARLEAELNGRFAPIVLKKSAN